mgnify:CR=1 FL=1
MNIPNKPRDLCVKHWMLLEQSNREDEIIDRIIADAKEQPEPSFLEADGPMGDPERDLGVGQ